MNKVVLLGRLTKHPEVRILEQTNTKVVNFTLAVNRRYTKQGEETQTDFINIVAFAKSAEFAEKFFKKGLQICLSGRIETRSWDDDNGIRHYATNVIAEEFDFADSPKKTDASILNSSTPVNSNETDEVFSDDELPF